MERLIKYVLDALAELGNSQHVALFQIQENEGFGIVVGGFHQGEFILPGKYVEFEGSPLDDIIVTKQVKTYAGTLIDGLPFPVYETDNNSNDLNCLCLPLLNETHQVVGIIVIAHPSGFTVVEDRLRILEMLRGLVMSAVENARLFHLATVDSLTGLYIRHYFEIRLQEEFTRVRRHGGVVSLLMMDIDRLKQVNDTYGYQQGDRVLQEFAHLLRISTRRDIDLPCRYGGEKFAILLPNTDLEGAYILGERIRHTCEQHPFATIHGGLLNITISAGIATMNQSVAKEELIRRADLMLYAAKQAGRNQTMKYGRK
ncbi:MAG: hypothetical protein BWK79_17065 [Beggiatoa sp. IS2]|nr:MAG: hypothetical protein BWK79_17065 [Beggiatoa sp. IS2]